jgi:hypothetical protein
MSLNPLNGEVRFLTQPRRVPDNARRESQPPQRGSSIPDQPTSADPTSTRKWRLNPLNGEVRFLTPPSDSSTMPTG